jgi:telomerase reverse transcriptase
MARKRKRDTAEQVQEPTTTTAKRVKTCPEFGLGERQPTTTTTPIIQHPVLSAYYDRIISLRAYLLELLPASSKSRRRRLASVGRERDGQSEPRDGEDEAQFLESQRVSDLSRLLDTTLVGVLKAADTFANHSRQREFATFTQSQFRSSSGSTDAGPTSSLNEVSSALPPYHERNLGVKLT